MAPARQRARPKRVPMGHADRVHTAARQLRVPRPCPALGQPRPHGPESGVEAQPDVLPAPAARLLMC